MSVTQTLGKVRINPRGEWSNISTYTMLDMVSYLGSSYMALGNVDAGTSLTNTAYWMKLVNGMTDAQVEEVQAFIGSPLVANTIAEMTDEDRIYVYTGTEEGYTAGNWYYYDGAAWASGGIYNSQGIGDHTITMPKLGSDVTAFLERKKVLEYKTSGTYPTGWQKGFYEGNVGESYALSSSSNYICYHWSISVTNHQQLIGAKYIEIVPPAGYAVAIREASNGTVTAVYGAINTSSHPELAGVPLKVPFDEAKSYVLSLGKFSGTGSAAAADGTFIGTIQFNAYYDYAMKNDYLFKTGDYEFFTVDVQRPLPFSGEEVVVDTESIECVLRLPYTYSPYGEPTRLIFACHGQSGYVDAANNTWYNANWTSFMNALLSAGYAVFDCNIFPTGTGTSVMGLALGSPLYINVAKKAYDYIQEHYNVKKEIFVHGTSMGGVGATAFSYAYPQLVLAESSFAGRDILLYIQKIHDGTDALLPDIAKAYGYADFAALTADKFSHVEGLFPSLGLSPCINNTPVMLPSRDSDYTSWLEDYSQLMGFTRGMTPGDWTGKRTVPYKAWNSWADNEYCTKLETILQAAYNRGNQCPYYLVNYETGTHTEISHGLINDMRDQLIAWYRRFD